MADETKQIYESREWYTGDVITADALNKIENEMGYVSAEVTNAVTGTINDQKLNDTIARKLDSIVKYFPNPPSEEDKENVRLYVQPEENNGEITVPTIDDYQNFKANFVKPYTNKEYAVGDYVEYGDVIYRVLSAITKNGNLTDDEAWTALTAQTPSPVTSIDVMQELNGLINVYTSDNQVTSERNKIWIKQQGESVEVPTYEEFSDLKNTVNSITDGMIFSLTEKDMSAFIASKDHSTYSEGQIVQTGTSNYHIRIIRVRKGQWIKASLGNSKNINVLTYVQQDGTFIETIVQGGCYKYKYHVDRDGYIALCTNITSARNEVVLYSDNSNPSEDEYEIGWKNGYTILSGDIDQNTHDFTYDAAYGLSNPVYLYFGDTLTVNALASNSVAVFCIYNAETGVWSKTESGSSGSVYNNYTFTAKSVCRVYISHKFALENDEFTISVNRNHRTITSDFQTNNGLNFTSINQYTKPGMYALTSSTIADRPYNTAGALLVVQHNHGYVVQYYYIYSKQCLLVRLLGVNGTPYNEWMELEEINPETNTFIGNRTGNKYIDLTSEFTSINQFVKAPFFGQLYNTGITDLPMGRNGVLEVIPANNQYVLQRYYIYSRNLTLERFLGLNGTPYNEWRALGEPLFGKKIVGIGDSLMAGNQIGKSYTWLNLLGTQYGAVTYNYGDNGNPVANIGNEIGMVGRVPGIYETDGITEIDYFVLIGGANDKRLAVPIGEDDSVSDTEFCGALNTIISYVRSHWPKAHMVFLTNYDRYPSLNALGKTDIDYVEAMQRVCAKRHVYCYDNYHNSGVDFHDENFTSWADEGIYRGIDANAHFSPEGYKWLLPKYKALLEAN